MNLTPFLLGGLLASDITRGTWMSSGNRNNGKALERLVATIEKMVVPSGFTVATNTRHFEDGAQLAEFDIEVSGMIGTSDFKWLLQCRDWPSKGPQGTGWIRELASNKLPPFHFNKVTGVSTTGFSAGAQMLANDIGVELKTLVPDEGLEVADCFGDEVFATFTLTSLSAINAILFPIESTAEQKKVVEIFLADAKDLGQVVLEDSALGTDINLRDLFHKLVSGAEAVLDAARKKGSSLTAEITYEFPNQNEYFLRGVPKGPRLLGLKLGGRVSVRDELTFDMAMSRYLTNGTESRLVGEFSVDVPELGKVVEAVVVKDIAGGAAAISLREKSER